MKISRYYHTVKYLKARQLYYQFLRRFKPLALKISNNGKFHEKRGYVLKCSPWLSPEKSLTGERRFRFLNIENDFNGDWSNSGPGKLWNYNLNYMDFLLQSDISIEEGLKWINNFIACLPDNVCGREPYPVSIRCLNWVKFISSNRRNIPAGNLVKIDIALYGQFHALWKNPEYHLLGNHLLMNGVSLLSGAFYFHEQSFYDLSEAILTVQAEEQILNDGGHFELSPMYHQTVLSNLLDCINILLNNPGVFPSQEKLSGNLMRKASTMLGWLDNIIFSDGEIPLLNDSAYGIAPETRLLNEYAQMLGVDSGRSILSDSGYRRFAGRNYLCIADIGKIGPDYIPAHAHADTFSFVLCSGGSQVIVDPGISTYEKNSVRQMERDTVSHNTVTLEDKGSSDVWGGFRAGRRANVNTMVDEESELIAEHDGYSRFGTIHRRHFIFNDDSITVRDMLSGNKTGVVRLHFHPDRKVELSGNKIIVDCLLINTSGVYESYLRDYDYHPGFNRNVRSIKYEGIFKGSCELKFITG